MKVDRIQQLIPKVSQTLNLDNELVARVVAHQFKRLKEHFVDPPPTVTVQLDFLGKFRGHFNATEKKIKETISKLREDPTNEVLVKKLRKYWRIRRFLQKERERRNFKKRFNGWYYK